MTDWILLTLFAGVVVVALTGFGLSVLNLVSRAREFERSELPEVSSEREAA